MKAGDEIVIRLEAVESIGICNECYFYSECVSKTQQEFNWPCNGEDVIFKRIENLPEKSE